MDSSPSTTANSPVTSRTPFKSFGLCSEMTMQTNSNMRMIFRQSSKKLSTVEADCSAEIAELTKRQKEIRKEKNRITAKISRDRKVAYIQSLELLLQDAKLRIEVLEEELVSASHRLDAQHVQINAMGDMMSTNLMGDYASAIADPSLSFESDNE